MKSHTKNSQRYNKVIVISEYDICILSPQYTVNNKQSSVRDMDLT